MTIIFRFPPKLGLQSSLGDFLLSYAKALKFHNTGNQNVRFVSTNLRQSLMYCISRVDAEEDDQDFRLLDSVIFLP